MIVTTGHVPLLMPGSQIRFDEFYEGEKLIKRVREKPSIAPATLFRTNQGVKGAFGAAQRLCP
jgi:hypothetical protein